jgi:threonine/homoserine efflux transporter RhtA
MNLTIRTILLIAAVILFVIAIFSDVHQGDLIAVGLACTAGAFVVDELGLGTRIGTRRS